MSGGTPPTETAGAAPPEPRESIAKPAIRSSVWTLGGYGVGQIVRLGGNVLLARLLFPDVFGLMALVFVFVSGLAMFSDVGTGPAIVQSPRGDDERFLRTAWTIQCVRGGLLWAVSWIIAFPVAFFYGEPLLRWLVPAAAANALISGFESTAMHTAQRKLRLERLTILEVVSQVTGLLATVGLAAASRALHGANDPRAVWAMVAGSLVSSLTRVAMSHLYLPSIRHRFTLDRESMRQLLHFGRWIFVSTVLTFCAFQADRLIFGKMIPLALLGVYSIGATLAALPTEAVARLGNVVIFPAYARIHDRPDFNALYARVRFPVVVGGAAIVTALLAGGPFLVGFLYDARYAQAGWILQLLSAAAWFRMLGVTNEAALLATGRVKWMASGNGAKAVGMALTLPLGYRLAGFQGALAGIFVSELLKYLTLLTGVVRSGLSVLALDLLSTAGVVVAAIVATGVGAFAFGATGGNLAALLASTVVACALWGLVALWYLARTRGARGAAAADVPSA